MKGKRFFAALLCMILLLTAFFPASVFAADDTDSLSQSLPDESEVTADPPESAAAAENTQGETEADPAAKDELPEAGADKAGDEGSEKQHPAFEQSRTLNGVSVSVRAEKGIFPENAVLSVNQTQVLSEETVSKLRNSDAVVAASYTFDIKVINPASGEEYQPAEGQTVSVSFCMAEVADQNLDTSVYHISDDGNVEALNVTTNGETATAQTDGFSLYTVEFTYNSLQYVLHGDSEVLLSTILEEVGLTGEVTAVQVSNDSLFSASHESGEWVVKALSAFQTNEWMKVTIGGVVFEIKVTDTVAVCRNQNTNAEYETLEEAVNSASNGDTIIVLRDCTVDSAIEFDKSINMEGASGNEVISRNTAVNTGRIFGSTNQAAPITVSFKNIVLDGGAAWSLQGSDAASAKNRTDANEPAIEALLVFSGNVSLELNGGTVIQNCNTYRAPSMSYAYSAGAISCGTQNAVGEKTKIRLNNAVIKNCSAGGKVYSEAGGIACINYDNDNKIIFEMNASVVTGCAALANDDNTAGGLFLASCDTTIKNSQISGNYTYNFGAGLTQRWGISTITDSEIKGNDAGQSGGGIALYTSADCTLNGSTVVSDNIAKQGGGFDVTSNRNAPLSTSSKLTLADNVKILRNKATGAGGGILFLNCSNASIGENVEITLNESAKGGGIYTTSYERLGYLNLKGAIYQNKASNAGADLYAQSTLEEKISLPVASAMDKVYRDSSNVPRRITDWYYDYSDDRFDAVNNATGTYPNAGLRSDLALVAAGVEKYVFTVSFDANGHGTAPASQTVETGNTAAEPVAPTASGYSFGGWYTEAACINAFDFTTPITGNITLYAKWTEDVPTPPTPTYYTVSFNMSGHGTQITGQTVIDGGKATKPADPTASGYTFKGWYTDSTFQTAFDFNTAIHANITLYAKWVTNSVKPIDPNIPKTGDNSHMLLWVLLLAVSGAALTGTAIYGRKKKKTN